MATHAHSTTAPVVQAGLLPFTFRPSAPIDDPRSADELLEEIRRTIEGQVVFHGDTPICATRTLMGTHEAPHGGAGCFDIDTPLIARTIHLRRQLAQAAEHGVALLAALGLPRLVEPDFVPLDPTAIGVALDLAIATLDAVDGDTDLEDGGDDEPSLGWTGHVYQTAFNIGLAADLEHDTADCEPSLASPERHPTLPWEGNHARHYVTRGPQDRQTRWADGSRQDHEADITDELHDGNGEDLEAEPDEPILGATEEVDQTAWSESGTHDREFDATDCIDRHKPRADYEASVARRGDMVALTRRVEAMRRGVQAPTPHVYRDNVRPIAGAKCWEVSAHG